MASFTNKQLFVLGAVAVVGVGFVVWQGKKAAEKVGEAVNPLNNDNVFAEGVNAVGEQVSGEKGWSLGGWLHETFNPEAAARDREITGG